MLTFWSKFEGRKNLFDLAGLELKLEKKLTIRVVVVTYDSLNPLLKERIYQEEIRII